MVQLRGRLEGVEDSIARGWATDAARADESLAIEVLVDGLVVASVSADLARHDLQLAGVTGANCGFSVDLAGVLSDGLQHEIVARTADGHEELEGSPLTVRTGLGADPDVVSNLDPIEWSVKGWAYRISAPEVPLVLDVAIDGSHHSEVVCDLPRPDLEPTPHPSSCGFELGLPDSLVDGFPHVVDVRVQGSRRRVAGAPVTVQHRLIRSPIRAGSLALDTIRGESGDRAALAATLRETRRLAILATHRDSPRASLDALGLAEALRAAGYAVVMVDTSDTPLAPGNTGDAVNGAPVGSDSIDLVIHRRNTGWDFGSWFAGLGSLEEMLNDVEELILANDSNHGPFGDLRPLIDAAHGLDVDLWGCTDSYVGSHHLQSYFLGFRLRHEVRGQLMAFARAFDFPVKKSDIISRGEIGLSSAFREAGLSLAAVHPYQELVREFLRMIPERLERAAESLRVPGEPSSTDSSLQLLIDDIQCRRPRNPTLEFWDVLLERGHPFLKRQLLDSNPTNVVNLDQVADRLGHHVDSVNRDRQARGLMPIY